MRKDISLKWWQIALLAIAVSFLGGLSSLKGRDAERATYEKEFDQAPWAPPGWVFGPAWTFNNFFVLSALLMLLRQRNTRHRNALLTLQCLIWLVFFTFGYVYFNKKNTRLAAIWTIADALFAAGSLLIALKRNRNLALNYVPLLVWTGYASTVAVYQDLHHTD